MDKELEVIRTEMEETRSSLADKLEALEQQFKGTVEGATAAVENVKESVQETVENVKESVQETVENVKETLDVSAHVDRHPWLMVGGAVAVGFAAGCMLGSSKSEVALPPPAPPPYEPAVDGARNGAAAKHETAAEEPGPLQEALKLVQGLAVGVMMGTLRELIAQSVPRELANEAAGVVDQITTTLGGKPLQREEQRSEGASSSNAGATQHDRDAAEMGRKMGATRWSV